MIMPIDISPKDSLYYKGYLILEELKKTQSKSMSILDLVSKMEKLISPSSLTFALDWLFLIDIVELDNEGVVRYVAK